MSIDSIGDFLTIIRNGVFAVKRQVTVPYSNLKHQIAQVLKSEGFITDVVVETNENKHKNLIIHLKYADGESVIHEITRISSPGLRRYEGATSIKPVIGGLGISVLTTNRGIMTNKKARALGVGGEIICTVW